MKRSQLPAEARRLSQELCLRLGREPRGSRLARRMTQAQVAELARLSRSTLSRMELGRCAGQTIDAWMRATLAVQRPLRLDLPTDALARPSDSGHLEGQELVLHARGVKRFVELNTRPSDSRRAIDVAALDERRNLTLVIQVWNTFGDLGSAARGFDRELGATAEVAAGLGHPDVRVAGCRAIVDSRLNRELLRRYSEFFATRFPGSSVGWLRAIAGRALPPPQTGIVRLDLRRGEIVARRSR